MINYNCIFDKIIKNNGIVSSYIFYGDQKKSLEQAKIFSNKINNGNKYIHIIDKEKLLVDDIKNIVDSSKIVPRDKYKIFIINNFNNILNDFDDVLLKTLEESKKVIYILIVRNINTLKETVKSRCQKFYFKGNNKNLSDYLLGYMSQDFFKGFYNIPQLIDEQDVILLLEDFVSYLYLDEVDDYRIYNEIRSAIKDIKFGLEKQLVLENLIIKLKHMN